MGSNFSQEKSQDKNNLLEIFLQNSQPFKAKQKNVLSSVADV